MEADLRKRINPIIKITANIPTPILTLLNNWLAIEITAVPKKDAPFPQISMIPKYSPDLSAGMIFAKYERDKACIPP